MSRIIRSLKWIRDLLFQNLPWKLLSLAIAVVIWALVATEPELSTLTSVRLEYKNVPEGLEISAEPSATAIELELRGPAGALRGTGDGLHPEVVIDMSGVGVGEHTFAIEDRNVKLARGVHLVRAHPSQVRFRFEPKETKMVPVRVRFTGAAPAEYHVEPPRIEIAGPRSRVARISSVEADPIDLSSTLTNAGGETEFHTNVFLDDPFVRFVNAPEAVVTVTMQKK